MEAVGRTVERSREPNAKIDPRYSDIAATNWYEHGLPRLVDMFDRRNTL
jgi:hypothetical protein